MKRFIRFSHQDAPLGEISPNDVMSLVRREEINGEHSLEITTLQVLGKGERIVYQDERGIWREYEVTGVDEEHAAGTRIIGTYYCVWSIQQDLQGVTVSKMPGVQTPVTAAIALAAALETQARWTVGTVTNTNTGGASMYDMSAWQALSVLLENWGGELSTSIVVDNSGVIARRVDYYTQQGEQTAKRRYDFGKDVMSIKRTIADEPLYCRISPRGKGEETAGGGYGRKITIASVNDGKDYLEYSPMVNVAKIPNGSGSWQYPTKIIENSKCETPADLKSWAQSIIAEELTPKVTYDIDVMQAAREGVDMQGVSLGDSVHAVDRYFTDDGLRVTGRIVSTEVDELTGVPVSVTLGFIRETLGSKLASASQIASTALDSINSYRSYMSTADYIDNLLTRINTEINATGGYWYMIPGQGTRTYDKAVSDPSVGAEATKAVEIKGGTIRIADSKTAQGDWRWRTVFESGHIASELVTAANITSGFIGSTSGNYWNLDTGEMKMSSTASFIDDTGAEMTVEDIIDAAQGGEALKKLTVGGTNLLTGTRDIKYRESDGSWANSSWSGTSSGTGTRRISDVTDAPNNSIKKRIVIQGNGGRNDVVQADVPVEMGESYVLSCYAKSTTDTSRLYMAVGSFGATWKGAATAATRSWKRYVFRFTCGKNGAAPHDGKINVVFGNRGQGGFLSVCGMQLERGTVASDWKASPLDEEAHAVVSATMALDKAKTYTNEVSQTDREFTEEQRKALDASMNQAQIFKRLTNDGEAQGLYMKDGLLYLNGTYMKTGTLNAGIIRTGILQDAKQMNQWNMATGYLKTKSMQAEDANVTGQVTAGPADSTHMTLAEGELRGYHMDSKGRTMVGWLSPAVRMFDTGLNRTLYGMMLQSGDAISFHSPYLYVSTDKSPYKGNHKAFTGDVKLRGVVYNPTGRSFKLSDLRSGDVTFKFVNGMLVSFSKPSTM